MTGRWRATQRCLPQDHDDVLLVVAGALRVGWWGASGWYVYGMGLLLPRLVTHWRPTPALPRVRK